MPRSSPVLPSRRHPRPRRPSGRPAGGLSSGFRVRPALAAAAFGLLAAAAVLSGACSLLAPKPAPALLIVMSYNVKSLFDAEELGTEYADFSVAKGRWDEARYRRRLELLAEVVLAAESGRRGPDILCLLEVENRGVLEALRNGPLRDSGYREAALVAAPGQAIQSGILTRLPLLSLKAHGLAGAGASSGSGGGAGASSGAGGAGASSGSGGALGGGAGASMAAGGHEGRYLLEAEVEAAPGRSLRLFVCHWKSKLGGARETEGARREAAALLASRVAALLAADPGAEFLACGDFNENPDEYLRVGRRYETALMPVEAAARAGEATGAGDAAGGAAGGAAGDAATSAAAGGGGSGGAGGIPARPRLLVAGRRGEAGLSPSGAALYSPWADSAGYSYVHEGKPERIDGFLLPPGLLDGEGLTLSGFGPLDEAFLLDAAGAPRAWSSSSRSGYSDHLPLLLELALTSR